MQSSTPLSVVFSGYAPVHALTFLPLYERLKGDPAIEFWFSGGLRVGPKGDYSYDSKSLYDKVGIPQDQVISVEDACTRKFDVLFSASTSEIVPFANVGASVQIFHGVSMRNRGVRPENLRYDYLCLVGPFMQRLFAKLNILEMDDPRGVPIGFAKTDPLVDHSLDRDDILKRFGFDGSRPVLLYAPTGAEGNSMEMFGPDLIAAISSSNQYDLLVKPHDHPRNRLDQSSGLDSLKNAHCRMVTDLDVIPLLYASDLLITDASSVANEYTLLDKPLVFVEVPEVFSVTKTKGAYVDYDFRKTGVVVEGPADIVNGIEAELANPGLRSPERQKRAKDLFFNPGQATNVMVDWFYKEFLGKPTPSAIS